jgi:hypothetical protein
VQVNTSALAFGGSPLPGPTITAVTELWNGTSWTTNPKCTLNTARRMKQLAGAGTSNRRQ